MAKVVDAADRAQRRWSVLGYPIAVIYKYFDDQGNYLAAIITYYAFIAIFPLLLLGSSILGFFLQDNPELQQDLLDTALAQFPIIGDQLGRPEGLQGSTEAIVIGGLVALYGALGLGQALQNALNIAWSVPRNSRPNPVLLRLKSLFLLLTAGVAVLAVSVLSTLAANTEVFGETVSSYRWPITVATIVINTLVLTALFRVGAARSHSIWTGSVPGAVTASLLWIGLQKVGTLYVTNVLTETSAMNQTFGLVLGLIGIIWLTAVIGVLGIEVNVVLERRLWPRALLTPFTDRVELTEADRRAYTSYARAQRHKGFETVEVTFTDTQKLRLRSAEVEDDQADHVP
ncbi:YihY/virulence factor BrkB family protein [Nocardioides sp. LMS-CY]|uniref:YihY/virulence factor BrkB family protein n=1 Tax=Nocardioides sp. (strain LMS-CY) TaxID=2840457 RepID=UPI001C001D48|nr:YhjD/YihY/BrkB family envelope integrity protein [Nocardioides sp. LMS-CY]QWF22020.1 YihY/virulence factor BrkB family protein [Nocardioides sp. LMS-CY]